MSHCPYCNSELEQYVFHEGSRTEPPTTRLECVVCGPVDEDPASVFDERKPVFKLKG